MSRISLIPALIGAGAFTLFGVQNSETVTLHLLWFPAQSMPLSLSLMGGAGIGVLLSYLTDLPSRLKHARSRRAGKPRSVVELADRFRRALREMSTRGNMAARRREPRASMPPQ